MSFYSKSLHLRFNQSRRVIHSDRMGNGEAVQRDLLGVQSSNAPRRTSHLTAPPLPRPAALSQSLDTAPGASSGPGGTSRLQTHRTAGAGDARTVQILLDAGAAAPSRARTIGGATPLDVAQGNDRREAAAALQRAAEREAAAAAEADLEIESNDENEGVNVNVADHATWGDLRSLKRGGDGGEAAADGPSQGSLDIEAEARRAMWQWEW